MTDGNGSAAPAGGTSVRCLIPERRHFNGPVTRSLLGRSLAIYGGLCMLGVLPLALGRARDRAHAPGLWRKSRRPARDLRGRLDRGPRHARTGPLARSRRVAIDAASPKAKAFG